MGRDRFYYYDSNTNKTYRFNKDKGLVEVPSEVEVVYWSDEEGICYTTEGEFEYSDVIPNEDFTKVKVINWD